MKRMVASRKLSRTCNLCQCCFNKGDVYYTHRIIHNEDDGLYAIEQTRCARCKHKEDLHNERFERFKPSCPHPIVELEWSYIPGEAVMQPDHDECKVCGAWV